MRQRLQRSPATPAAILEAAARLLAEDGDASMADLAGAAGVGRATLYRYYPSREALLAALTAEALDELAGRLPTPASKRPASRRRSEDRARRAHRRRPLRRARARACEGRPRRRGTRLHRANPTRSRARHRRGTASGRHPVDVQLALFSGVLQAGVRLASERRLGHEDAAAAVTRAYLDGARRR